MTTTPAKTDILATPPGSSVEEHVRFLANPALDGRVPLSPGSKAAREYIIATLQKCGVKPLFDGKSSYTQQIDVYGVVHGTNVGGIIAGKEPGYVLVGAHYDHLPCSPGANDNAAAVAQVIAAAGQLGKRGENDGRSILFLAFDCEEPPHFHGPTMGSIYFATHCPVPLDEIQVAIILDLTGHRIPKPGLENFVFAMGTEYATTAYDTVMETAEIAMDIRLFCTSNARAGDLSDHHVFRAHGRPFIFLSCGHGKHYHQPTDTIENLDLAKTAAIASFLGNLVGKCADGRKFTIDMCGGDFREKEASGLSKILGRRVAVDEVDGIVESLRSGL